MFSSFSSAGAGKLRLASRSILRSSKSSASNHHLSRFTGVAKTRGNRLFSESGKETAKVAETTASKTTTEAKAKPVVGWWKSPEWWGFAGSMAAWGMSASAIYDSALQGPEVISLTMTPVLMVYSGLFARWAWVVKPRNLSLMYCHIANVAAQTNQLRRALEHKMGIGEEEEVTEMVRQVGILGGVAGAAVLGGPAARSALSNANLGVVSSVAAADAGPFTVHFWAPMSKVFISGASMLELDRPTDKISLPQYAALTTTGFFFTRYALLVTPVNYTLCAVNVALFLSSFWHFGRKIKADYIDDKL